jgi:outer membrane protein, adhesin transport system
MSSPFTKFMVLAILVAVSLLVPAMSDASDLTLDDMVAATLQASPSVKAQQATVSAGQQSSEAARWLRYPSLSIQAENRISGSAAYPGTNNQIGATARVDLPLWSAGRIAAEIDAAALRVVAAEWGLEDSREQVALRTVTLWRSMLSAASAVRSDDLTLERLAVFGERLRRRVDAGVSAPVDLDALQARTLQVTADRASAVAQLKLSTSRLILQAGFPPDFDLARGMMSVERQLRKALDSPVLPDLARIEEQIRQKPAYLKALAEAQVAQREISVVQARRFPELLARYQYQEGRSGIPSGYGYFLSLNYQPGSGLAIVSQVKAALSRYEASQRAADNVSVEAAEALIADLQEYSDAAARLAQAAQAIEKSQEVLEASLRLFDAGRRSALDILTALRELSINQRALAPLQAQLIAARYALDLRLGRHHWQKRGNGP